MNILTILKPVVLAVSAIGLLSSAGMAGGGAAPAIAQMEGHESNLAARLVLSDGAVRTVTLEGVGCSQAMCSRVAVTAKARGEAQFKKTWLDSISAIRDITEDEALVLFKDGTQRRLSINPINRVLYLAGGTGKIDLSRIQSLEFISAQ